VITIPTLKKGVDILSNSSMSLPTENGAGSRRAVGPFQKRRDSPRSRGGGGEDHTQADFTSGGLTTLALVIKCHLEHGARAWPSGLNVPGGSSSACIFAQYQS
jgi:hypothetical protein